MDRFFLNIYCYTNIFEYIFVLLHEVVLHSGVPVKPCVLLRVDVQRVDHLRAAEDVAMTTV